MHDDSCELCGTAREARLREAGRRTKMLTDIRSHGYHKVGVFSEDEEESEFAYTVGMFHTYRHPELVVFGMSVEEEFAILDRVRDLVADGATFSHESKSTDVLSGSSVIFLDVSREEYDEYLVQAENFYRSDDFPALLISWPNAEGIFPWEIAAPGWLTQKQPAVWSATPSS